MQQNCDMSLLKHHVNVITSCQYYYTIKTVSHVVDAHHFLDVIHHNYTDGVIRTACILLHVLLLNRISVVNKDGCHELHGPMVFLFSQHTSSKEMKKLNKYLDSKQVLDICDLDI